MGLSDPVVDLPALRRERRDLILALVATALLLAFFVHGIPAMFRAGLWSGAFLTVTSAFVAGVGAHIVKRIRRLSSEIADVVVTSVMLE